MSYPLEVLKTELERARRDQALLARNVEGYTKSLRTGAAIDPSYTQGQIRRNTEEYEQNQTRRDELIHTIRILEAIEGP